MTDGEQITPADSLQPHKLKPQASLPRCGRVRRSAEIRITNMKTPIKLAIAITSMGWAILNAEESAKPPTPQPDPQQAEASAKRDKLPYRGVQFEYKFARLSGNAEMTLNSLGEEGWELVAIAPTPDRDRANLYYLKRQKIIAPRPRVTPPPIQPHVDSPVKDQSPTP